MLDSVILGLNDGFTVFVVLTLLLEVLSVEALVENVLILELDTEFVWLFVVIAVFVWVVLAVCDADIVEVVDTDELSVIQPEYVSSCEAVIVCIDVTDTELRADWVFDADGVALVDIIGLLDIDSELLSEYDIVINPVVLGIFEAEYLELFVNVVVTVFVTPVGNAVILAVPEPILEVETDNEFVRVIIGEREIEALTVCVFEFVVLSVPVFVIIIVCVIIGVFVFVVEDDCDLETILDAVRVDDTVDVFELLDELDIVVVWVVLFELCELAV